MKTLHLDRHMVASKVDFLLTVVASGKTSIVIEREGKPYVALVPYAHTDSKRSPPKRRNKD